jgi:hypothetical protein
MVLVSVQVDLQTIQLGTFLNEHAVSVDTAGVPSLFESPYLSS